MLALGDRRDHWLGHHKPKFVEGKFAKGPDVEMDRDCTPLYSTARRVRNPLSRLGCLCSTCSCVLHADLVLQLYIQAGHLASERKPHYSKSTCPIWVQMSSFTGGASNLVGVFECCADRTSASSLDSTFDIVRVLDLCLDAPT